MLDYRFKYSLLAAGLGICCVNACAQPTNENPPALSYPNTEQVDVVDDYHGVKITDPYQWMEDLNSTELANWMEQQGNVTDQYLGGPVWDSTKDRISELENYEIQNPPIKEAGKLFFSRWPSIANDRAGIYVIDPDTATPRLLTQSPFHFDGEDEAAQIRFGGFAPSRTGNTLAYASTSDGSRWYQIRFVDVASGALLQDELRGIHFIAGPASWGPEAESLHYVRFNEPEPENILSAAPLNGRVFLHQLGADQSTDKLIFDPGDDNLVPSVLASLDGRYSIVHVFDPATQNNIVAVIDLNDETAPPRLLFDGDGARFTYLDNDGETFWFFTNKDAPNGRIIAVDVSSGVSRTVVAERAEPMSGGSFTGGNAIGKFGDQFVVLFMKDGIPLLRIFGLDGELKNELNIPAGGSIWGGFVGRADDPELFFGFLGMFDPRTVFQLDARDGAMSLYSRSAPAALDPEKFEVSQVFYDSDDGVTIPMFLAHKKGLKPDGTHPAFLYGYGAFGWNSFLFYQSHLLAWIEMGGVYAQPSLRGGGEYGQAWHDAGKGVNKENTVADFNAAASWLIENGYANNETLVANGGSASSMPAATAMLRRQDLYGAGIFDRPALDMLRFNQFSQGRLWLDEFGEPTDPEGFAALRRISPYHNLIDGKCYPPTMIMVGETDPVTSPLHGYKFVARMQNAQNCDNPVLLYLMPDTAHNFGSTPEQVVNSRTAMVVFLMKSLGLEPR